MHSLPHLIRPVEMSNKSVFLPGDSEIDQLHKIFMVINSSCSAPFNVICATQPTDYDLRTLTFLSEIFLVTFCVRQTQCFINLTSNDSTRPDLTRPVPSTLATKSNLSSLRSVLL